MLTSVKGGTGAGQRMHVTAVPKEPWSCPDGHLNPGFARTCMTAGCREKRSKETS